MQQDDRKTPAGDRTKPGAPALLDAALNPRAVAVIGASDNPHKIGGRPLLYLSKFGYRGQVYPINPNRTLVQGHQAFPDIGAVPEVPDLAIIATPGAQAEQAVRDCAARGVRIAIVMASGFGETHDPASIAAERRMVEHARAAGMRIVGPNSQGLANFGTGAVASFSTMFLESPPADGPVAIVSHSGAMSVVPYGLLRARGIGVRHAHATGNDSDISLPELALAVTHDPDVRLLLLYMEGLRDPAMLARTADAARARDLPIVAVKSGRTSRGQAAARSHTGAPANDDRVVDAFLRANGIWRVHDVNELVEAAELYLKGWRPAGRRIAVVSNSGASCVMAADVSEEVGLELSSLANTTVDAIARQLPTFATPTNPVDLTAALLTNSELLSGILPLLAADEAVDQLLVSVPVAGKGYDVPAFARAAAAFAAQTNKPVVVAATQDSVAEAFRNAGVPTFVSETRAIGALAQLTHHTALLRRSLSEGEAAPGDLRLPREVSRSLSEAQSVECLAPLGLPFVPHHVCRSAAEAQTAFRRFDGPVTLRVNAQDVPAEIADRFVRANVRTVDDVAVAFGELEAGLRAQHLTHDGFIVTPVQPAGDALLLAARVDPLFGPVLMIGDRGRDADALEDATLLLGPMDVPGVREALESPRPTPAGKHAQRGQALDQFCAHAVALYRFIAAHATRIASIRLHAVVLNEDGEIAIGGARVERFVEEGSAAVTPVAMPAER